MKFSIAWDFHAHEISMKFLDLKFLLPPPAFRLTPFFFRLSATP
jgi:hypothetical protein